MALQLVAAVLMGLFLLAVVLWIGRGIDWRSNDLLVARPGGEGIASLANSPALWVVGFLALALGLTGIAILAVGDFGISVPGVGTLAIAALGSVALLYLVGGSYAAVRDRNVSAAGATLVVALILGTLLLVAITGTLLTGS